MSPDLARQVADSLDCDADLLDHLPHLFADFDELGGSADEIVALMEYASLPEGARVIDLGCGKGAVSVAIAQRLNLRVLGVDAMPDFIESARRRANEAAVGHLCDFRCQSIQDAIETADRFDAALLIAVGPALGDAAATVGGLRRIVRPGGIILIDDAYVIAERPVRAIYQSYSTHQNTLDRLRSHGDTIEYERTIYASTVAHQNADYLARLARAAADLKRRRPDLTQSIDRFLDGQREENRVLEAQVACATWLIRRAPD